MRNPSRSRRVIARAGLPAKKYLSRPSQISRTSPTKRLRSRRSVNLSAGREGFFPNPKRALSLRGKYGKVIRSEYQRMRGKTGGVVGEDARRSLDLARARAEFNRRDDVEIKYFPEEESYESVYGEKPPEGAEFVTVAINIKGRPAASLGFVEANDRNYLRQVENELLAEAFASEEKSRPSRRSAPLRNPDGAADKEKRQILSAYDAGWGYAKIARTVGVNKKRVLSILAEYGRIPPDHGQHAEDAIEIRAKLRRNPTRKSRALISLTGQHSGKVYGFAEERDLSPDRAGALRRTALALANKFHEPIRFERVSVTTLSPKMRENPAPRAEQIAAAQRRFTRFTGHKAENVRQMPFPENPGAALAVGPVVVLGYSATRDGKTENYLHKFKPHATPMLAASHDGKSLYLLGGRYRFTERGIVDVKNR